MHTSQKELLASREKLDRALMTLSQNLLRHAIIHGIDVESNFESYETEALEYEKKAAETKESISAALSLLVTSPASIHAVRNRASCTTALLLKLWRIAMSLYLNLI